MEEHLFLQTGHQNGATEAGPLLLVTIISVMLNEVGSLGW